MMGACFMLAVAVLLLCFFGLCGAFVILPAGLSPSGAPVGVSRRGTLKLPAPPRCPRRRLEVDADAEAAAVRVRRVRFRTIGASLGGPDTEEESFSSETFSTVVKDGLLKSIRFTWILLLALTTFSTAAFKLLEKLSWTDAFYMSATSIATVGPGDVIIAGFRRPLMSRLLAILLSSMGLVAVGSLATVTLEMRVKDSEWITMNTREKFKGLAWIVGGLVGIGTLGMKAAGGEGWGAACYKVCETLTTLGLGDIPPRNATTKVFLALYSLFGTAIFGAIVGSVASIPLQMSTEKAKEKVLESVPEVLTEEVFEFLSKGDEVRRLGLNENDGSCSRDEFTLLLLVQQGIVTEDNLKECREKFYKLDVNGNGRLERNDLDQLKLRGEVKKYVRKWHSFTRWRKRWRTRQ